jgi:hypothetical protein
VEHDGMLVTVQAGFEAAFRCGSREGPVDVLALKMGLGWFSMCERDAGIAAGTASDGGSG